MPSPCRLYDDNSGYRKKSEVAMEIFEEIEEIVNRNKYKSYLPHSHCWSWSYRGAQIVLELAELRKKYEREGAD